MRRLPSSGGPGRYQRGRPSASGAGAITVVGVPYPLPDNPHYCPRSNQPVPGWDHDRLWFRCPDCARLIAAKPNRHFFAHLDHPGRRNDSVQESLDAFGLNTRNPGAEAARAAPTPPGTALARGRAGCRRAGDGTEPG